MKYKAVPTTCGCGQPRRKGQRDCKECHAAAARRSRMMPAAQKLGRTMASVARQQRGKPLPPEIKAQLDAMAKRVAREIEQFNQMAGAA